MNRAVVSFLGLFLFLGGVFAALAMFLNQPDGVPCVPSYEQLYSVLMVNNPFNGQWFQDIRDSVSMVMDMFDSTGFDVIELAAGFLLFVRGMLLALLLPFQLVWYLLTVLFKIATYTQADCYVMPVPEVSSSLAINPLISLGGLRG